MLKWLNSHIIKSSPNLDCKLQYFIHFYLICLFLFTQRFVQVVLQIRANQNRSRRRAVCLRWRGQPVSRLHQQRFTWYSSLMWSKLNHTLLKSWFKNAWIQVCILHPESSETWFSLTWTWTKLVTKIIGQYNVNKMIKFMHSKFHKSRIVVFSHELWGLSLQAAHLI